MVVIVWSFYSTIVIVIRVILHLVSFFDGHCNVVIMCLVSLTVTGDHCNGGIYVVVSLNGDHCNESL